MQLYDHNHKRWSTVIIAYFTLLSDLSRQRSQIPQNYQASAYLQWLRSGFFQLISNDLNTANGLVFHWFLDTISCFQQFDKAWGWLGKGLKGSKGFYFLARVRWVILCLDAYFVLTRTSEWCIRSLWSTCLDRTTC